MTKKKKIIAITVPISAVLIIIVIGLIIGYSIQHKTLLAIQTNDIKIELDNKEHTISALDFIDEASTKKATANFVDKDLSELKITADSVSSTDEKIKIKCKKAPLLAINKNVKIKIVDNTPPEFTEKVDSITINKGEEIDVVSKFSATDLSGKVEITVDDTIDVNTVGTQTVNVFATDESGNVAQTEVNVVVNENEGQNNENTETVLNNNNEAISKSNNMAGTTQKTSSKKTTSSSNNTTNNNKTSSNNNKSSNNYSGSTTTSSNNTSSKDTSTVPKTSCTNNSNHSIKCGNMGKWFNNRSEVESYVISVSNEINAKYHNGEISYEEKCKQVPVGYECWSCSYCGKWTGNFKYR